MLRLLFPGRCATELGALCLLFSGRCATEFEAFHLLFPGSCATELGALRLLFLGHCATELGVLRLLFSSHYANELGPLCLLFPGRCGSDLEYVNYFSLVFMQPIYQILPRSPVISPGVPQVESYPYQIAKKRSQDSKILEAELEISKSCRRAQFSGLVKINGQKKTPVEDHWD